jgi:hypothetical protein
MPIYRGTVYEKPLVFANRSDGLPIDISLWQFQATLKDATGADLLDMSTALGHFTVEDGPNGRLLWSLTPTETAALAAGKVYFGIYRTDDADGLRRYARCEELVMEQD